MCLCNSAWDPRLPRSLGLRVLCGTLLFQPWLQSSRSASQSESALLDSQPEDSPPHPRNHAEPSAASISQPALPGPGSAPSENPSSLEQQMEGRSYVQGPCILTIFPLCSR